MDLALEAVVSEILAAGGPAAAGLCRDVRAHGMRHGAAEGRRQAAAVLAAVRESVAAAATERAAWGWGVATAPAGKVLGGAPVSPPCWVLTVNGRMVFVGVKDRLPDGAMLWAREGDAGWHKVPRG